MKAFDDPLFRSLSDRSLELGKGHTSGVTPSAR